MLIGVPKETLEYESRVAMTPEAAAKLSRKGYKVLVEKGAGAGSHFSDEAYREKGVEIADAARGVYERADILVKVQPPSDDEIESLREGQILVSLLQPLTNHDLVRKLAERRVTSLSLELIPRITRAQSMDVLSSMSTLAGYRAVLQAANALPRMFPLMMTAAGTLPAAKVFVIGAGVAGLQAIATSRRLGAVVSAFDTRPAVKEQVLSLGAKFVEIEVGGGEAEGGYARELTPEEQEKQRRLMSDTIAQSDVVITTALVPGRKAPLLIPEETVKRMRTGTVIVDLAAEAGGNCELTVPGDRVVRHGVTIFGYLNLPATLSIDASSMFGRNIATLLLSLTKDGELQLDANDEVLKGCLVTRGGEVVHPRVKELLNGESSPPDVPTLGAEEPASGQQPAPVEDGVEAPQETGTGDNSESESADTEKAESERKEE